MKIPIEQIKSVYIGAANECCCGCRGQHYHSSIYLNDDEGEIYEERDRAIETVQRYIDDPAVEIVKDHNNEHISHLHVEIGDQWYICYLATEDEQRKVNIKKLKPQIIRQLGDMK